MVPLLALAVAGVAGLSLKPPVIDHVQYSHIVQVSAAATQAVKQCRTENVDLRPLVFQTQTLVEYETHLNTNTEPGIAKDLQQLVKQFEHRTTYSVKYCQHKLSEIQAASRTMARAVSGVSKYNFCDSNVEERFYWYQESYALDLISKSEFKELAEDVRHLAGTDRKACSTDQAIKLDQSIQVITDVIGMMEGL